MGLRSEIDRLFVRYDDVFGIVGKSQSVRFDQVAVGPAVHFVVEAEHVFILRIDRERLFVRSVAERRPVRGRYGERIRFFAEIVARDREVEPRDRQFVRNRQRDRRDPSGFQRSVDRHAEASRLVTVLVVSRETDVAADVARTQE